MGIASIRLGLPFAVFACTACVATPLWAMEGVDNLTVRNCGSTEKATVEDAFRAANLLVHYSWTALNALQTIKDSPDKWQQSMPPNFRIHKYTDIHFDFDRILKEYARVFGPYDYERWKVVDLKYAAMTPIPLKVVAVCTPPERKECSGSTVAFREEASSASATIGICPIFFEFRLEEARKLPMYESVSEIALYQAGVVVHEFMHLQFMGNKSGHDFEYGLNKVLSLSKNPGRAINNPDSFHAFTMLIYGLGTAPKCTRAPDRWRNC